jgi:hypothetical protein
MWPIYRRIQTNGIACTDLCGVSSAAASIITSDVTKHDSLRKHFAASINASGPLGAASTSRYLSISHGFRFRCDIYIYIYIINISSISISFWCRWIYQSRIDFDVDLIYQSRIDFDVDFYLMYIYIYIYIYLFWSWGRWRWESWSILGTTTRGIHSIMIMRISSKLTTLFSSIRAWSPFHHRPRRMHWYALFIYIYIYIYIYM